MSDSELKDCELSNFDLDAGEVGRGFIPVIRMGHIKDKESVSYVDYQPQTGIIRQITPVGKKTKVKTAVFLDTTLLSPNSGAPLALSKMEATTPQGKNKFIPDMVVGSVFTPQGKTEHQVIRLRGKEDGITSSDINDEAKKEEFKQQFKLEVNSAESEQSSPPEFRGGTVLLTADDVEYRSSKNKQKGGHRSLFSKPGHVMNDKSAKLAAQELGLLTKACANWDWGHLLPAGGTAQGIEANLDPYNFLAVPATLNTWQMVPEMMARHLAKLGFEVEYTALGRAEFNAETEEYSFVAKEIYSSVKLRHHDLMAEFFTTRENHAKPLITDAVHMLSNFYKIAGKPVPTDLKEKFQKELEVKLAEMKKVYPPEAFLSPVQTIPAKQYPFLERNKDLIFSPSYSVRPGFKDLTNHDKKKKSKSKTKKPKLVLLLDGSEDDLLDNQENQVTNKRLVSDIHDVEAKEEHISKRTRSRSRLGQ